ncbi:MAG TPA: FtsW/RodA/SpoVE family cell cycle protein [Chloroflexota bacterium]|nr:FtsW/RodA/SpoVE family cell cycle protein [Chloroflexota bacterium]
MALIRRPLELALLAFPVALLAAALGLMAIVRGGEDPGSTVRIVAIFAAVLIAFHLTIAIRLPQADQELLPIVETLVALGLIAVDRLVPGLAPRQLLWVGLGSTAATATAVGIPRIDWLGRYRYTWLMGGLLLLALTIVFGIDPNGSQTRLWIGANGLYFQPSEITKVVAVIFFASYLADKRDLITHAPIRIGRLSLPPLAYLGPLVLMWGLSLVLLVWQRDLGVALLFYLIFLFLLYAATGRTYVGVGIAFLCVGALVSLALFDHVQLRTRIWLDPWPSAAGDAYQLVQALTAYAAGGVLGAGLGFGYPEYVPAVHTDFVLAALGEELGLLGTIAIVGLYVALVFRAFRIALRATSDFAMLFAAGLGTVLGVQALIIMAGNLRLMPITGITLPFLSYGGSSILANFVMVGLLLRISAESPSDGGSGG